MNDLLQKRAENNFNKVAKRAFFQRFNRVKSQIPTLEILRREVPVESETYIGTKDIEVCRILGTEDRSDDFTLGFNPKNSHTKKRWLAVYCLLNSGRLSESIKVIKYGGYYFVRDGNHRVSVAKCSGIEYLTADITEYKIAVNIPRSFCMCSLSVFKEKYEFNKRTSIFDYTNQDDFDVRKPETWSMIEKEIFVYNKSWYERNVNEGAPPDDILIANWYKRLYLNIISHIEKHSLLYLFPGMGKSDIFIEFIKYWNSFDNPDQFWVEEAYSNFTKQIQKRRFFLMLIQTTVSTMSSIFRSEEDDRKYLESITSLSNIRPQFKLENSSKSFYRFLYKQIVVNHALMLKKRLNRPPYFQEVISDWYDNYYNPIFMKYKSDDKIRDFSKFFRRFSRKYYHKICYKNVSIENILF